ncbi:cytochrome c peroxidase [Oceanicoccus sagamiensis]|uniref:cytochrome c peroxidase n=1 Tax=Oceanicoccus sagamiensis TaxID=716816 RepID=UPI000A26B18B|nr:cytochrome c peroxidase [Oceanicoccus sagamiensis]
MKVSVLCLLMLFMAIDSWGETSEDRKLEKIIEVYSIEACEKVADRKLFILGEKFFKSKELSGERDVSCETCHIEEVGFSDGIPIAVGVGGEGESEERLYSGGGILVQRNAFSLFNRGHPQFKNFFGMEKLIPIKIFFIARLGWKYPQSLTLHSLLQPYYRSLSEMSFLGRAVF